MMTTLTITLPHTPRCLSPNAKAPLTQRGAIVAGYKKTAAKSRARTMAGAVTLEALNGRRMQPTHYRVVWFYKGNKPDGGPYVVGAGLETPPCTVTGDWSGGFHGIV